MLDAIVPRAPVYHAIGFDRLDGDDPRCRVLVTPMHLQIGSRFWRDPGLGRIEAAARIVKEIRWPISRSCRRSMSRECHLVRRDSEKHEHGDEHAKPHALLFLAKIHSSPFFKGTHTWV